MARRLRIGLIGAGGIARSQHIPAYKAHADQVELVAVADLNRERAEAVAQEYGFARAYGDMREMLAQERLDAVSVCTPNKFHAESSIAALGAGCHVLCEKPPGLNAAEVEEMAAAAEKAGKVLTFGFHHRFEGESVTARRLIAAGELGQIYTGRVTYLRRRGIPSWGVFTRKDLQGGGALVDIGVHMLDLALYLLGYPRAEWVMGMTYNLLGSRPGTGPWGPWDWEHFEVEDGAFGMIRFKGGATLLLETAWAAHTGADEYNVRLLGTGGGLQIKPLQVYTDLHGAMVDLTPAWVPGGQPYHAEVGHFLRCCRGEAEPVSTPAEALALQRIIDAIYRSAAGGRPVQLARA